MRLHFHPHEDADRILRDEDYWPELTGVLHAIDWQDIVREHDDADTQRAGGQTATNAVIRRRLLALGWSDQPRLFDAAEKPNWSMDFHKGIVGVEVVFNNDQYMPWALDRLMLARRDASVRPDHRVRVGVVVVATDRLKRWAKFDGTCATFEKLRDVWLPHLAPILTFPIMAIGIDAAQGEDVWQEADSPWRGTTTGLRQAGLAAIAAEATDEGEAYDEQDQDQLDLGD